MIKLEAIIERAADGTFDVYCKDEIFSGMAFYKNTAISEGFKYPAFLDDEYEIVYSLDAKSLLKYYVDSGFFSLAGLEKMTGISQKQLWTYLHGTKPRKIQANRIVSGFRALNNDLSALFV